MSALASIARWAPMPASVATLLYDEYPAYREALLTNTAIPGSVWARLDPQSIPSAQLAHLLRRADTGPLVERICAGNSRPVSVLQTILHEWTLPIRTQQALTAKQMPQGVANAVMGSYIEDEYQLHVTKTSQPERRSVLNWLIANPAIDGDQYLSLLKDGYVDPAEAVTILGQRADLASQIVDEFSPESLPAYLMAAALVLPPGRELDRFVSRVADTVTPTNLSRLLPMVHLLLARVDLSDDAADKLVDLLEPRPRRVLEPWRLVIDAVGGRVGALDRLGTAEATRVLEAFTTIHGYSHKQSRQQDYRPAPVWWQMVVLLRRGDIPEITARKALSLIPGHVFRSSLLDSLYGRFEEGYGADQQIRMMQRRAAARAAVAKRREVAARITSPQHWADEVGSDRRPYDLSLAAGEVTVGQLDTGTRTVIRPKLYRTVDIETYLVEHLGDGRDQRSRTAWRTACHLIEKAPDERTLEEVVRAVDALTTVRQAETVT